MTARRLPSVPPHLDLDMCLQPDALTSRQPWRLELTDSLIPPEDRTPDRTAILEITCYPPLDLHLTLHWLQCLEVELILKPFSATLRPATFAQIVQRAYGGRFVDRTPAVYTIDLYGHWEGGFCHTIWPTLTDEPYSTAALTAQMQQRTLAPEGLGEFLLEGLAQETRAQRGWITGTPAHLQHGREWGAYFALCGDTLTTWTHLLHRAETVNDTPTCDVLPSAPWHEAWRLGRMASGSPGASTGGT